MPIFPQIDILAPLSFNRKNDPEVFVSHQLRKNGRGCSPAILLSAAYCTIKVTFTLCVGAEVPVPVEVTVTV